MPLVCEPWFEFPLVTEWTKDGETSYQATRIDRYRVNVRDMPSVFGSDAEVVMSMNNYDQWEREMEREQMEEANNRGKI